MLMGALQCSAPPLPVRPAHHQDPHPLSRACPPSAPLSLFHPPQVTLAGREGYWNELMGPYELSAEPAHGYPRCSKRAGGGKTHWLFRSSGNGKWYATGDESHIAKNMGYISSARAAALPTEAGLAWQYHDGAAWQDDPKMTCTEAGDEMAEKAHNARVT